MYIACALGYVPSVFFVPFLGTSLPRALGTVPGLVFEIHGATLNAKGSGVLSSRSHKSVRTSDGGNDTLSENRGERKH